MVKQTPLALQALRAQIESLHSRIREQVRMGDLSYMTLQLPEALPVRGRLSFALAQLATLKERELNMRSSCKLFPHGGV